MIRTLCLTLAVVVISSSVFAQKSKHDKQPAKKTPKPFRWVNPIPEGNWVNGLKHQTFKSPSMNVDVGYCIYLPPGYETKKNSKTLEIEPCKPTKNR